MEAPDRVRTKCEKCGAYFIRGPDDRQMEQELCHLCRPKSKLVYLEDEDGGVTYWKE